MMGGRYLKRSTPSHFVYIIELEFITKLKPKSLRKIILDVLTDLIDSFTTYDNQF